MLSLGAPLWLLGLVLLPAIRWLHRGGRHRRVLPVARLALWQGAAARSPAAGDKQPPDPAWRRRALLAALLLLALAEPRWAPRQPAVTLWVDDSLSMLTLEPQGTRLALALAQARSLLADLPGAQVELRSLGDPWQRLGAPGDTALAALAALAAPVEGAGRTSPAAPPVALLHAHRQHWLLTDGVQAAPWPDGRQPDRVVQVGSTARNVGLSRLAARRSPGDPDRLDLLVEIRNGGSAEDTRELVVSSGEHAVRSRHRLAAGASVLVTAQVAAAGHVRATLLPSDALAADDELLLDLSPLRRHRVAVDAACPAALRAAVATHPALSPTPTESDTAGANAVAARLECGGDGAGGVSGGGESSGSGSGRVGGSAVGGALPTLRVPAGATARRPAGAAQWSSALAEWQRVHLEPGQLPLAATLALRPHDAVLLALGDEPVIVRRASVAPLLDCALDFTALAAERGAQTPLLVNLLFEQLLGGRLLGAVASTGRGAAASRVVPAVGAASAASAVARAGPVATAHKDTMPADARHLRPGTRAVLWVAMLALLWEAAALARQWARLRRPVQPRPP